jgi:hypothetical protein
MAFLGDFGNIFLGGAKTGDVAGATASFFGADPVTALSIQQTSQAAADRLSGPRDAPDVATTPAAAGVDSPATLSQVSQTGQLQPAQIGGMAAPRQAFIGGLAPLVGQGLGQAARLLSRPGVAPTVGGFAAGAVADFFVDQFGNTKKLVITRKMQRDVKKLFVMSGGDFNMTAQLYQMATGRSITGEQVVQIITKTFKNQGPYVTKAAVRKTRSTIRKMETLCDLKDRLAPPRRAAPRRRATTATKILQVK